MSAAPVVHHTFVVERNYPSPPDRIFAAFSDPEAKRRWFASGGHASLESFEMDFRVGGSEHASYRMNDQTPFPGAVYSTHTGYADIIPGSRIVFAYGTDFQERRISLCQVTVELSAAGGGTALKLTHQGAYFEGADGPAIREQGWRQILDRLAEETGA